MPRVVTSVLVTVTVMTMATTVWITLMTAAMVIVYVTANTGIPPTLVAIHASLTVTARILVTNVSSIHKIVAMDHVF